MGYHRSALARYKGFSASRSGRNNPRYSSNPNNLGNSSPIMFNFAKLSLTASLAVLSGFCLLPTFAMNVPRASLDVEITPTELPQCGDLTITITGGTAPYEIFVAFGGATMFSVGESDSVVFVWQDFLAEGTSGHFQVRDNEGDVGFSTTFEVIAGTDDCGLVN